MQKERGMKRTLAHSGIQGVSTRRVVSNGSWGRTAREERREQRGKISVGIWAEILRVCPQYMGMFKSFTANQVFVLVRFLRERFAKNSI